MKLKLFLILFVAAIYYYGCDAGSNKHEEYPDVDNKSMTDTTSEKGNYPSKESDTNTIQH